MAERDAVWRAGEDAAVETYRRRGFRVLARNWRSPLGELDLVVARGGLVVFCEVKARGGSAFGGGHEAVTPAKRRKVRALAEAFLASRGAREPVACRFDVASVRIDARGTANLHLYEDAF